MRESLLKTVFILGIAQRSGTNFLYNLIKLHPKCAGFQPMEDFLIHHSDLLLQYSSLVSQHYKPEWDIQQEKIISSIGSGLKSFLHRRNDGKLIVTKTPSVRNINNIFALFPDARLLILVRDGRSTVESNVRSFGFGYEESMVDWVTGAQAILEFDQRFKDTDFSSQYMILKYENIYRSTVSEMRKVLAFLGLNYKLYDFNAALSLPIRDSSQLMDAGEKEIHWKPIEKKDDFDPLNRWKNWNKHTIDRFNWVAGKYMTQFDYELSSSGINPRMSRIQNHFLDWKNSLSKIKFLLGRIFRKIKKLWFDD